MFMGKTMKRIILIFCVLTMLSNLDCSTYQLVEIETASQKGDIQSVKKILSTGADVNVHDGMPLSLAAENGHVEVVTYLLSNGAKVNLKKQSKIPLNLAAANGHRNVVKLLLDKGANIESLDRGNTPLVDALKNDNFDTAKLLASRGANIDHANKILKEAGPIASIAYTAKLNMLRYETSGIPGINNPRPSYDYTNQILLAVIDFEAKGISKKESQTASDWLRTEMINTGAFKVIERSAMDTILKEQAFSMTGCTDTTCAVRVGKLLSAKKMLIGNIEKWNDRIYINGRIIDVEKGVAEFAHKETVRTMDDLDEGVARFAEKLTLRTKGHPVE